MSAGLTYGVPTRCAMASYRVKVSQIRSECASASAAIAAGRLVPAIGLHDPQGLLRSRPDRLALSSGTQPVSSLALSGYRHTAFVPRGPWRQLSSEEQRLLLATEPPISIGGHITVVRAPDDVMVHFDALRECAHSCGSVGELRAWLNRHPCTTGCDALLELARAYLRSDEPLLEGAAVSCNASGLPTATTDDGGTRVGLHVDNWYRTKLPDRANAPNRISINLGVKARFFLYVNLPLAAIGALAVEKFPSDSRIHDPQHGLRSLFMSHFGSYPVVRVRLDPGDGYIAPTENIIHDAIASENVPDIQFCVRGRFWPQ